MKQIIIIGAGLVGLATAYQLLNLNPSLKITICEKEKKPAQHQSGRNSGVVHSGVYYRPGSLKAKNCLEGRKELLRFCEERSLPLQQIHKVIIARDAREMAYLRELETRAKANGVSSAQIVGQEQLRNIEPHVSAKEAIYLPECHIIDYSRVAEALCQEITNFGGEIIFEEEIREFRKKVLIGTKRHYDSCLTINCAGLHSDRIAKAFFGFVEHQILPFRGEYYLLQDAKREIVKGLIYPVPDPKFPFLGVHLTPMINGKVEAGPNAVLAMAREGYKRSDINFRDLGEIIAYPGFWKMAGMYWKIGIYEMMRSASKKLFLRDVQQLIPSIVEADLLPGGSGIRAQLVKKDGKMLDDFAFMEDETSIHVINAPSPAATACFSIGKTIAEKALAKLK